MLIASGQIAASMEKYSIIGHSNCGVAHLGTRLHCQ